MLSFLAPAVITLGKNKDLFAVRLLQKFSNKSTFLGIEL